MEKGKVLTKDAETRLGIIKVEKLMDQLGISITGNNLVLVLKEKEYRIGRDSDEFPRFIDEPLILVE